LINLYSKATFTYFLFVGKSLFGLDLTVL